MRRRSEDQLPRHPAELLLINGMRSCNAASATFYVPDPYWADDLRLAFFPGVVLHEPLYGFLFPQEARDMVTGGSDEIEIKKYPKVLPRTIDAYPHKRLAGQFYERENVGATVRLKRTTNGHVDAVMFANFADSDTKFPPSLLTSLDALFEDMLESVPSITRHIRNVAPFPISGLISALKPFADLSGLLCTQPLSSIESYLRKVLTATISACQFDIAASFGTVHLFDEYSKRLRLFAAIGNYDAKATNAADVSVSNWDGVISWVANRRRSLLIRDLATSPFRQLHIAMGQSTVCELAVPMMAGDQLVGVFNIESSRPLLVNSMGASDIVRIAWHAANQAAIACRFHREAQALTRQREIADQNAHITKEILAVCAELPELKDVGPPLGKVAKLASSVLSAKRCDLWRFDANSNRFVGMGADYPNPSFDVPPRTAGGTGWSAYVQSQDCPVWIADIRSETEFKAYRWIGKTWEHVTNGPNSIHARLLSQEVGSELGIPIRLAQHVVGVAWVKYEERDRPKPTDELLTIALGLAGECALVFSSFQLQDEFAKRTELKTFEMVIQALRHDAPDRFLGAVLSDLKNIGDSALSESKRHQWTECLSVLRTFLFNLDILLPSRGESGFRQPPEIVSCNLRQLIEDVVGVSNLIFSSPEVAVNIDDSVTVDCDVALTKIAIYILIDNARKYVKTDDDGRPTGVTPIQVAFQNNVLSIRDSGTGISKEVLAKIGNTIGLRDPPPGRSVPGSGLGAFLCRALLLRQKHGIQWNSDGTSFTEAQICLGGMTT